MIHKIEREKLVCHWLLEPPLKVTQTPIKLNLTMLPEQFYKLGTKYQTYKPMETPLLKPPQLVTSFPLVTSMVYFRSPVD